MNINITPVRYSVTVCVRTLRLSLKVVEEGGTPGV